MSILTCSAARGQAPVVEAVHQAANIFKLVGIIPATRGQVELLLSDAHGEQSTVAVWPGILGSYYGVQKLLLQRGLIFRDSRFERGPARFRRWRRELDQLLHAAGNKATV